MLFATVVCGRISDRIGPAKPMLAGLVIFLVGLVVAGTSQHMAQLVTGRLVQGLGGGTMNVAIFVCVAQAYSLTQRPKMFTYISTAWVLPSFVGPPVSAWLTQHLSWHWVSSRYPARHLRCRDGVSELLRMMRAHRPTDPTTPNLRQCRLLDYLPSLPRAAARSQRLDWLAVGQRLEVWRVFWWHCRHSCHQDSRFRPGLPQVVQTRGLLAGAFFGAEAFVPLMLVEQRSVPLLQAGAVLTVGAIGWTVGSWLQSRPWLPIQRDRLITLGCVAVAFGVALVGLIAFLPTLSYLWVAVADFSGLGMGLATSSSSLAVMSLSTAAEQGRNASSLNVADALGSGIFVGIAGSIFAALSSSGDLALTLASCSCRWLLSGCWQFSRRGASAKCGTSSRHAEPGNLTQHQDGDEH
jgi:MFS family permease